MTAAMNVRRLRPDVVIGVLATLLSMALPAAAQTGLSSIAGAVKDASGAVVPGVTVEASSPALIEKTRSVVSDGQGLYSFVGLQPGVYTVVFELSGFSTVRREGVELPAGFTATINAEMRVGAIEESITVSGQSPLVDVQTTKAGETFSREVTETLPGNRTPQGYAGLIPGVTGTLNVAATESKSYSIHGSTAGEANTLIDGFTDTGARGAGGGSSTFYMNPVLIQEVNVTTGGATAEQTIAGLMTNIVLKDGGNAFHGLVFGLKSSADFQSNNLTAKQKELGLTSTSGLVQQFDLSPAFGGPIVRDRVWFFSGYRNSRLTRSIAGLYYNADPLGWTYKPDLTRPAVVRVDDLSYSTRLTWQATSKDKITANYELQPHIVHQRGYGALTSPEATAYVPFVPNLFSQLHWQSPLTNRLFITAGSAIVANVLDDRLQINPAVARGVASATEQSTGMVFRSATASTGYYGKLISHAYNTRGSVTYGAGSQMLKAGVDYRTGMSNVTTDYNADYQVRLNNGVPNQLTLLIPFWHETWVKQLGIYAQERYTVKRLTINAGLRYDYLKITAAATHQRQTTFTPERDFPEVDNLPNWKDLSPRFGIAYDPFGDGKTAIKFALNRFVAGYITSISTANNPVLTSVTQTTRVWNDANANFVPDCVLTNPAANGECQANQNSNFGKSNPSATTWDPNVLKGFRKSDYNWETSVAVQRELLPGLSAEAAYFRRAFGNLRVTDNTLVGADDYDPYCITAPVDPRLPDGGGYRMCGLYDLKPAKVGQVQSNTTFAENFGKQTQIFNGVDLTSDARLPHGLRVSGGVSFGRTATNNCFVIDSPQQLNFCDVKPLFKPNAKINIIYPLPWWSLRASGVIWSEAGPQITASYPASNAEISPSLGRNLSSGANATVQLIKPGTMFAPQVNQVDARVQRSFSLGRQTQLRVNVDVYNLGNASGVQTLNVNYGSAWQRPQTTLDGRTLKFSGQLDF